MFPDVLPSGDSGEVLARYCAGQGVPKPCRRTRPLWMRIVQGRGGLIFVGVEGIWLQRRIDSFNVVLLTLPLELGCRFHQNLEATIPLLGTHNSLRSRREPIPASRDAARKLDPEEVGAWRDIAETQEALVGCHGHGIKPDDEVFGQLQGPEHISISEMARRRRNNSRFRHGSDWNSPVCRDLWQSVDAFVLLVEELVAVNVA